MPLGGPAGNISYEKNADRFGESLSIDTESSYGGLLPFYPQLFSICNFSLKKLSLACGDGFNYLAAFAMSPMVQRRR